VTLKGEGIMNIFVVVQENEKGSLLLSADVDRATAEKGLAYHKSISNNNVRLAEIELTNKRLQF
jgi:hypothetical protein